MPTDPTRSTAKRERVERNFRSSWRSLRGAVRRELSGGSYYRPQNERSIGQQTAAFRDWLEHEIDTQVVEPVYSRHQIERGNHWTGRIVREFYEHGIDLAHSHLRDAGATHPALEASPDAIIRDDTERFGGEGLHQERLEENYAEFYNDLVDVGREVAKQGYREYRDAARSGGTVSETVERINDRIEKVGSTRTDLVARTKLIQTINDAVLARYIQLGVSEVGVDVEDADAAEEGDAIADGGTLSQQAATAHDHPHGPEIEAQHQGEDADHVRQVYETAGDNRVCQYCAFYEGMVVTVAEIASGAAPSPPLHPNCRCVWRVFDVSDLGWT